MQHCVKCCNTLFVFNSVQYIWKLLYFCNISNNKFLLFSAWTYLWHNFNSQRYYKIFHLEIGKVDTQLHSQHLRKFVYSPVLRPILSMWNHTSSRYQKLILRLCCLKTYTFHNFALFFMINTFVYLFKTHIVRSK